MRAQTCVSGAEDTTGGHSFLVSVNVEINRLYFVKQLQMITESHHIPCTQVYNTFVATNENMSKMYY